MRLSQISLYFSRLKKAYFGHSENEVGYNYRMVLNDIDSIVLSSIFLQLVLDLLCLRDLHNHVDKDVDLHNVVSVVSFASAVFFLS